VQRVEVQPVRRVVSIHENPVAYYLSRLAPDNTHHAESQLRLFFGWLNQQDGWVGVTPRQLLVKQLQAEDEYAIVDLIQQYLDGRHELRAGSKRQTLTIIRSFFRKNRCALPEGAEFTIRAETPPTEAKLTVKEIREAVGGLSLCWRSLFLVKYQALLDTKRLAWLNLHGAEQITRQLREEKRLVRIDVPCGRKKNANERKGMYFTYFGADAAESLRKYFNDVRGWPGPGQPIWTWTKEDPHHTQDPRVLPLDRRAISAKWLRLTRRLNLIPEKPAHGKNHRYGFNLHEFRDVAITELHVKAKSKGLDMDCTKFWAGQVGQLDPLKYDKFDKDQAYVEKQYQIAEPYLNILSNPVAREHEELSKENEELRTDLAKVTQDLAQMRVSMDELRRGQLGPLSKEDVARMVEAYLAKK
jgi:hypothetical protein